MLQFKVLIRKLVAVNALATRAIVIGKVTALAHEIGNDAMEGRLRKAKAFFARAQGSKVLRGLGDDIRA
jgi:hypothetical protein